MRKLFLFVLIFNMYSCEFKDTYEITSPKGDKKLSFQWVNTFNPYDNGHIKIFLSDSEEHSISLRSYMDFPLNVWWGDSIKLRGGILVGSDSIAGNINWREDYTELEAAELKFDTVNWKHYYLSQIPEGYYK